MKRVQLLATAIFLNFSTIAQNKWDSTGNVGIGTRNPQSALQIGEYSVNDRRKIILPGVYNFERLSLGQEGNGNSAIEFLNHTIGTKSIGVKMGTNLDVFGSGFYITTAPESAIDSLQYKTTPALFINTANNVGIGTSNMAGYRLAVAGSMIAERIKVKVQSGWPDYVFDSSYNLLPLKQVEDFVKEHKHLPQIPSSKEVTETGLDIGSNQAILLQKIEELTLYLIGQDTVIKEQQQLLKEQDKRLKQLEKNN